LFASITPILELAGPGPLIVYPFKSIVMPLPPTIIPSVLQSRFADSFTLFVITSPHDKLVLTGSVASSELGWAVPLVLAVASAALIGSLVSLLLEVGLFKKLSMLLWADAKVGWVNKAPTDANAIIAAMRYILLYIQTNKSMYNIYGKLLFVPNSTLLSIEHKLLITRLFRTFLV
jgi:hypothetical protein